MDDLVSDAVEIGQRNKESLELARACCRHVRPDRGGLGVGLVEQATGLPVTGGILTCDYACAARARRRSEANSGVRPSPTP
jgi:hypothetical protein